MPFARPTLSGLIQQARAALARALGAVGLLRFSPEDAQAVVQAGLTNELHKHLDWIAKQSVPFDAEDEYLEAWANLVGVTRKPATAASRSMSFPGSAGFTLPAGSIINLAGGSVSYVTTADAAVVNGTAVAPATATTAGVVGNADPGIAVSLQAGVAGISASGVVAAVIADGADEEDNDAFRLRMLLRWAEPPQGGAASDYLQWALAVPGVTRAWVAPNGYGAGTVVVFTMWDTAEAAHAGLPQGTNGVASGETRDLVATGDQLAVANYIYPLRPVTALVYSCAPVLVPVDFPIHTQGLVPQSVRDAVAAAIDQVFLQLASPLGAELEMSPFEAAISSVSGMPAFTLLASARTTPLGYLPVRGNVTYA